MIKLTTGTKERRLSLYVNPLLVAVIKEQIGDYPACVVYAGSAYPVFETADEIASMVDNEMKGDAR